MNAVFRETIPAGDWWVHEIKQGQTLRILDLEGNQAADTLFFSAADPTERYSADRTIQEQAALYLTTGTKLMSTEGRALLTITADTCGRHDTLGGACSRESNTMRYAHDKECMHACRDSFIRGAQEWNVELTKRDITCNINFFMNVPVTPDGRPHLRRRHLRPGPICRNARRDGCRLPHLQLPPAQQPLQRLEPDTGGSSDFRSDRSGGL
jgi:uncharacterized protein